MTAPGGPGTAEPGPNAEPDPAEQQSETLATNARMISLARKAGFTIAPSPEVRGVMLLSKALPGNQACNDAEAASLAA